jgi:hypothetical protein
MKLLYIIWSMIPTLVLGVLATTRACCYYLSLRLTTLHIRQGTVLTRIVTNCATNKYVKFLMVTWRGD